MTTDRPAHDTENEIEVTPEMIEVGREPLERFFEEEIIDRGISVPLLLGRIFRAMRTLEITREADEVAAQPDNSQFIAGGGRVFADKRDLRASLQTAAPSPDRPSGS